MMSSARRMRQRPLTVQHTPSYKMMKALGELRHKKMIRQLLIEAAHRHGIAIVDREVEDAAK